MAITDTSASNYGNFFGALTGGGAGSWAMENATKDQFGSYDKGKDPIARTNKRFDKLWDDPFNRGSMEILQPIASYTWGERGPWAPQQGYLEDMFGRAGSLVGRGQAPESIQAQLMRLYTADNLGGLLDYFGGGAAGGLRGGFDALGRAQPTLGFLMDPRILSPESNPFLAAQGSAVSQEVTNNLLQNILPQLRSGAVSAGQFGGSREGIAQGLAVGSTNSALSNALANLYGGAYQQGLGTMLSAANASTNMAGAYGGLANMSPSIGTALAAMYGIPADIFASVGRERETFPWWELEKYKDIIGGKYGETERGVETDPGYKVGESLIDTFMGNFGSMFAGMCWVADELYGVGSARAAVVRRFTHKHLNDHTKLGQFVRRYARDGRRWAQDIRTNRARRTKALRLWDEFYRMAKEEI